MTFCVLFLGLIDVALSAFLTSGLINNALIAFLGLIIDVLCAFLGLIIDVLSAFLGFINWVFFDKR